MNPTNSKPCMPSVEDLADFISWTGRFQDRRPGFCAFCGRQLETPEQALLQPPRFMCDHIATDARLYAAAKQRSQAGLSIDKWVKECPELYKELMMIAADPARRPEARRFDWKAYDDCIAWYPTQNDKQHLLCRGETGAGKTTSLWHKIRLFARLGRNFEVLTASELPTRLSGNNAFNLRKGIVQRLKNVSVLGIDDFGKEEMSSTIESILFDIMDYRFSERKTMIITTRYTSNELHGRFFEKSKATDITRRFNDYCRMPIFHDQTKIQKQEEIEL